MKKFSEIRKHMYDYNYGSYPNLMSWKHPYTRFKSILYMECGSVVVWFCMWWHEKVEAASKREEDGVYPYLDKLGRKTK